MLTLGFVKVTRGYVKKAELKKKGGAEALHLIVLAFM
jgi:hypothetical protein